MYTTGICNITNNSEQKRFFPALKHKLLKQFKMAEYINFSDLWED
jgi:hypothetical protein